MKVHAYTNYVAAVAVLLLQHFATNTTYTAENAVSVEGDRVTVSLTGNDRMKYNINKFTVPAGSTVRIKMKNIGKLPVESLGHNVVVLKQGQDPLAYATQAIQAKDNDDFPESLENQVIAHTRLPGPGETGAIEFQTPPPGEYDYLCSSPAHYQTGMKDKMVVEG